MFAGAYWSQRPETREQAAQRIAAFLKMLAECSCELSSWYLKGRTRAGALKQALRLDGEAIAEKLRVNRKDVSREVMPELGFSLGVWNGSDVSLAMTIGATSMYVPNSVVLSAESGSGILGDDVWRQVLHGLIRAFDPEHAVVASTEQLARSGSGRPWEVGWLTYERGGTCVEHPTRR